MVPDALQPFVTVSKEERGETTVEVAAGNLIAALRVLRRPQGTSGSD